MKYRYYPTPTLYIYHAQDYFYSESNLSWGKQISLLPLLLLILEVNKWYIFCVYVTANWSYFCTVKGSQVLFGLEFIFGVVEASLSCCPTPRCAVVSCVHSANCPHGISLGENDIPIKSCFQSELRVMGIAL